MSYTIYEITLFTLFGLFIVSIIGLFIGLTAFEECEWGEYLCRIPTEKVYYEMSQRNSEIANSCAEECMEASESKAKSCFLSCWYS